MALTRPPRSANAGVFFSCSLGPRVRICSHHSTGKKWTQPEISGKIFPSSLAPRTRLVWVGEQVFLSPLVSLWVSEYLSIDLGNSFERREKPLILLAFKDLWGRNTLAFFSWGPWSALSMLKITASELAPSPAEPLNVHHSHIWRIRLRVVRVSPFQHLWSRQRCCIPASVSYEGLHSFEEGMKGRWNVRVWNPN